MRSENTDITDLDHQLNGCNLNVKNQKIKLMKMSKDAVPLVSSRGFRRRPVSTDSQCRTLNDAVRLIVLTDCPRSLSSSFREIVRFYLDDTD